MSRSMYRKAGTLPRNRLRIIGGRWRGAKIDFPPVDAIRPSPDRVRETLFNWLQEHVVGAKCLDLFAGSGALGIEALSRGAAHVTFIDEDPRVVSHIGETLKRLGASDYEVLSKDAMRYLQRRPDKRFALVFLDPPFGANLLPGALEALAGGWLQPGAHIYVECPADSVLAALPIGWTVYRSKRAGQVGYHLIRAATSAAEAAS